MDLSAKPFLEEKEADAHPQVIRCGWIRQGPEVAAYERKFADCADAIHACVVSNCPAALHQVLLAALR